MQITINAVRRAFICLVAFFFVQNLLKGFQVGGDVSASADANRPPADASERRTANETLPTDASERKTANETSTAAAVGETKTIKPTQPPPPGGVRYSQRPYEPPPGGRERYFSSCLLFMDDNHRLVEWIAYHHFALRMRRLVIAVDPYSRRRPEIHDGWLGADQNLTVTVWDDADFLPPHVNVTRDPGDDPTQLRNKSRNRQANFYAACAKLLKGEGATYTTFHDTDEFVTVSEEYYRNRSRNHSSSEFRWRPAHVLDLIEEATRADPDGPDADAYLQLSLACVHIPRAMYSAIDEPDEAIRRGGIPGWVDPDRLDTVRFRYRQTIRGSRNGLAKAVIDVSRVADEDFVAGGYGHRPIRAACYIGSMYKNYGDCPLGIHHYLGSWEAYSHRDNDARWGMTKGRKDWEEKNTVAVGGPDDEIRPWVTGFEDAMGTALAKDLLKGAGLPRSST